MNFINSYILLTPLTPGGYYLFYNCLQLCFDTSWLCIIVVSQRCVKQIICDCPLC